MKYKFLFIFLALAFQVQAENFTSGGVRYTIISNTDKTVEVASSNQSAGSDGSASYDGDVVIPETVSYNGRSYTVIGIGQSAFVNCVGMTSISLPSTLTYIRQEAFNVCISLVEITIPRNVTSIGYNIFSVTSISKITVESSTPATCDYNAFQYPQDYNNCVLYVPAGSKSKYQNASEWKLFKSIFELGPEPGFLNGHEYVDLGLPSGNLWATSNYGASSPTEYGSYLEWYQCGYVASSWGDSWRTPSRTEMNELVNKCTWTWTTENGVKGYRVTGTNGNKIFLPAGGFKMNIGGGVQSSGEQLYYWTTTSDGGGFSYALVASSSSIGTSTAYNTSVMMCSVRPCADKISSSLMDTYNYAIAWQGEDLIVISNASSDTVVRLYGIDGTFYSNRIKADGDRYEVSFSALPKGIYLLNINNNRTIKIYRK